MSLLNIMGARARTWKRHIFTAVLIGTTFAHNALLGRWYLHKRAAERERSAYELRVERQSIVATAKPKTVIAAAGHALKKRGASVLLQGAPSISAKFIDAELRRHKSPAAGNGKAFVELGLRYGIDPAIALAFFRAESNYGTKGIARKTRSIGNIRSAGWHGVRYRGFRSYHSYYAGIEDFYRLLKNSRYYVKGGRTTLEQIVPIYAPAAENPTAMYLRNIKNAVLEYRKKPGQSK